MRRVASWAFPRSRSGSAASRARRRITCTARRLGLPRARDPRERLPVDAILAQLRNPVYVTVDLDAFDPAYVPGVGTPEPGGDWEEGLKLLRAVCERRQVVGSTSSSCAPSRDSPRQTSSRRSSEQDARIPGALPRRLPAQGGTARGRSVSQIRRSPDRCSAQRRRAPIAEALKAAVRLAKNQERRLRSGHPWVFSNEIESIEEGLAPGDEVVVLDHRGQPIGVGLLQPSFADRGPPLRAPRPPIDADLVRDRIELALRLRRGSCPSRPRIV